MVKKMKMVYFCIKCDEQTESNYTPQIINEEAFEVERCAVCTHIKSYFDKKGRKVSEPRGLIRGQLLITSFCIAPKRKEQAKDLVKAGKFASLSELFRMATNDLINREHSKGEA